MDMRWRIELLGTLRATRGDQLLSRFLTQKNAALLAYLAYFRQRSHRREELVELLWPEGDPRAGRNSLKQALATLRHQLEPDSVPSGAVLIADRTTVQLNPEAVVTDIAEFRAALRSAARSEEREQRVQCLARALDRYRGELLPGFFDDWVLQERQWLTESYFQALAQLLTHLQQTGDYPRALQYAQRGVSADPLREEAHRDLIRLYAAVGQQSAALRQYQELERLLKEQLNTEPEPATRALAREIERLAVLRPSGVQAFRRSGVGEGTLAIPERLNARTPERLTPEGENRLVTVLFADMSRSVQTTADLEPEDAAALVNRLLTAMVDAVLKYEGRVDRFLGDGALAVFGALQAHEDDAERAVRAAMEIRESARHLDLEITAGINTGEVYVGALGSERHQEMSVVGPVVNLASRLQEQAEPGQILVGEGTYRQSRGAFEFSSLSLPIRGLAHPVTAYSVDRARPHPEKPRGIEGLRAELIGRDEELSRLKTALVAVTSGRGQTVTLIGEAGVGKSRLVAELKAAVGYSGAEVAEPEHLNTRTPEHLTWLEGRCLELSMTTGYSLFVDLLRDYFAWPPEEEEVDRVARLVAGLQEQVERGDLTAERADETGPLLGNLLSLRSGTDWDLRLKNASPEQIRHQTLLAVRDFFVALAARQPLVLVCEDLHWADRLSLDLLALLMEAVPLAPLLLLCVYRPERDHPCWRLGTLAAQKCPEQYTELPLRELTPPQSRRLVESLLALDQLPSSIREPILAKSRGNPFFLEEIVRGMIESGTLYRDGEAWRAREPETGDAGSETIQVPESLQALILSRVDRLRPDAKQLLQTASVIGRLFRRRLLEQMADEEPDLPRLLWDLEERGLIYQERVVPEEEYSFKHVLTQETIYRSLLRRQQTALHQQVGEAIERLYRDELEEQYEQLAYHYEHSEADGKAVEYLLKAGEKARRAYSNEAAIGYFQRALARMESLRAGEIREQWRLDAHRGLGRVYRATGSLSEAEAQFRQGIDVGRRAELAPSKVVPLYYWLGSILWWQNRLEEAIRGGEEGLALLGAGAECLEAVLMRDQIAWASALRGDAERGRRLTLENAQLLPQLPYTEELSPVYTHVICAYCQFENDTRQASKWAQALEGHARKAHDMLGLFNADLHTGWMVSVPEGDLNGGIAYFRKSLELGINMGDERRQGHAMVPLVDALVSLGELAEAETTASQALPILEAVGHRVYVGRVSQAIGVVFLCQGRWDEARSAFQKAADCFRGRDPSDSWEAHWLGQVCFAQGDRESAAAQFEAAIAREGRASPSLLSALEAACSNAEAFHAFCRRFLEEHPRAEDDRLVQWYLEPSEPLVRYFAVRDSELPSRHETLGRSATKASTSRLVFPPHFVPGPRWLRTKREIPV
jgi:adenylate cyclase